VLGPTRVVVPTRDFANGVAWLEASESLEAMPARVDPPHVRFRLSERVRSGRRELKLGLLVGCVESYGFVQMLARERKIYRQPMRARPIEIAELAMRR
jgi:hypothetical protein